ncbi:MAG: serine/threonine-protein kinase, partial [Acidobacteriaceae bacterium]|nr:serine/threonine-protein kinase [Acidobacteriaceae bacterium]
MTDEQWRAAWILCETAGDLDAEAQCEYVRGATIDPEVESRVLAVFEELQMAAAYPPAADRRVGDTVGRYLLIERIGQGGMGEVYSAEDTELRRTVALKFLPSAVEADHASTSQVISEARLASRLNHPNIVTVYELIQTSWGLAIAMELVEGQSLRKLLKAKRLPAQRVIHIGRQLASALAAAHQKGIVHRDIKPENVMVREDDFVKVLDFGLAQNIRDQAAANRKISLPVGTVRYMSPEQKAGQAVTSASDIYSLALVLEEAGIAEHSILTRMRSPEPLRRPTASEVEQVLARLEVPSQKRFVVALLLCLLLLVSVAMYWLRSVKERSVPKFEQITHYSSGHDITAATLSRSGDELAYATIDGGFFVRNNRSGKVRELTGPERLTCYQLLFPSDQDLLAIGSADGKFEAWQIPLASDTPRRLADDMQMAAVSHDGKQIAWLNSSHQVCVRANPGAAERLLMSVPAGTHLAALFWSEDDRRLWVHRLSGCRGSADRPDVTINPDFCDSSDLAAADLHPGHNTISIGPLRFTSGFFKASGAFVFLRQDFARDSAAFNIWSLPLNSRTGQLTSTLKQISHFSHATLSNLTGTVNGQTMFVVRTDTSDPIYTADWEPKPPSMRRSLRLTSEENYNYPHAWSADSQSVIFESGRNGHSEIFRQNIRRREPELLASSGRENYYPQLSPDGKWVLFMSERKVQARGTVDGGFVDMRLMRVPKTGGQIFEVPLGERLDEFRCSVPGSGNICVLRTTHNGRQTYYELDPVKGKGPELGGTNFALVGMLGRWALSADGRRVAIPDNSGPGRFTELRLDPNPSKREQLSRQVSGMDVIISGMNPGHSSGEWLAWTDPESRKAPQSTLPPFSLGPSQFSALYFVDARLHAHLLENDSLH